MKIRRILLKDTVTISTYQGDGAYGAVFADPVNVRVNVDTTRKLVRDANGEQVVSDVTLAAHPQTRDDQGGTHDPVALFAPGSKVTVNGRDSEVIGTRAATIRGTTAWVEVTCT